MSTTKPAARRKPGPSKGERREAEILSATTGLLATRTLNELTIDDIAVAAGISRTTFYFYFPTKQAVIIALLDGLWERFGSTYKWLQSEGPAADLLREHHMRVSEVWRENQAVLQCTSEFVDYEPLAEWIEKAHLRFIEALAEKIAHDQQSGSAPSGIAPFDLARMVSELRDKRFPQLSLLSESELEAGIDGLTQVVLRMIYCSHG